jgi:hypothetical protein
MQAFFLGVMVSWTPSLILLAWMFRHEAGLEDEARGVQH